MSNKYYEKLFEELEYIKNNPRGVKAVVKEAQQWSAEEYAQKKKEWEQQQEKPQKEQEQKRYNYIKNRVRDLESYNRSHGYPQIDFLSNFDQRYNKFKHIKNNEELIKNIIHGKFYQEKGIVDRAFEEKKKEQKKKLSPQSADTAEAPKKTEETPIKAPMQTSPNVKTVDIQPGWGWSHVAKQLYGDWKMWPHLQKANPQIKVLHPGKMQLNVPELEAVKQQPIPKGVEYQGYKGKQTDVDFNKISPEDQQRIIANIPVLLNRDLYEIYKGQPEQQLEQQLLERINSGKNQWSVKYRQDLAKQQIKDGYIKKWLEQQKPKSPEAKKQERIKQIKEQIDQTKQMAKQYQSVEDAKKPIVATEIRDKFFNLAEKGLIANYFIHLAELNDKNLVQNVIGKETPSESSIGQLMASYNQKYYKNRSLRDLITDYNYLERIKDIFKSSGLKNRVNYIDKIQKKILVRRKNLGENK